MRKKLLKAPSLFLSILVLSLISCSENADDEKYRSTPPLFSNMEVRALETGKLFPHNHVVRANEPLVLTAVQSAHGHLLNSSKYQWTCDKLNDEVGHKYKKSVIYDHEKGNPTDTLTFPQAGTYKITFTGSYNISGQPDTYASTQDLDSIKVRYTTEGILRYKVEVSKTINVR